MLALKNSEAYNSFLSSRCEEIVQGLAEYKLQLNKFLVSVSELENTLNESQNEMLQKIVNEAFTLESISRVGIYKNSTVDKVDILKLK